MSLGRGSLQQHLEVVLEAYIYTVFLSLQTFPFSCFNLFDTTVDWLITCRSSSRSSCDVILTCRHVFYPMVSVAFGFKAFKHFEIKN